MSRFLRSSVGRVFGWSTVAVAAGATIASASAGPAAHTAANTSIAYKASRAFGPSNVRAAPRYTNVVGRWLPRGNYDVHAKVTVFASDGPGSDCVLLVDGREVDHSRQSNRATHPLQFAGAMGGQQVQSVALACRGISWTASDAKITALQVDAVG